MSDNGFDNITPAMDFKSKAAKPDLFYGDYKKVEEWLLQLGLYFHFATEALEDQERILFASTYMRGRAAQWIKPYVNRCLTNSKPEEVIANYGSFEDKLKQLFGIADEEAAAERAIQNLKQVKSVAEYAAEFQHLAIQTGWEDKSLMRMYKQGLKRHIREELLRSGTDPEDLNELYDETIRLDAEWYELNMEFKQDKKVSHHGGNRPYHYQVAPQRKVKAKTSTRNSYSYDPMDLDNLEMGNKRKGNPSKQASKEGRPFRKENRSCYNCGKPGHIAKNCRSNKVVRQLNVLTIKGPEDAYDGGAYDDEWEILEPMEELGLQDAPADSEATGSPDSRLYEDAVEDHDSDKENRPPRSPTPHPASLKREDANAVNVWKYLVQNDVQPRDDIALHHEGVYGKTEEELEQLWPKETEHRGRKRTKETRYIVEDPTYEPKYYLDYRNPEHAKMHWTTCGTTYCSAHWQAKTNNYFPSEKTRCRYQWYDCKINHCDQHLWDKRMSESFPGATDKEVIGMGIIVNGRCTREDWQTCLNHECERHYDAKRINGFGSLKASKAFLDHMAALRE